MEKYKNIINFILGNHQFSGKRLEGKSKKEVYHRSEREFEKLKTTLTTNLERASAKRLTDEKGGKEIIDFAEPAKFLEQSCPQLSCRFAFEDYNLKRGDKDHHFRDQRPLSLESTPPPPPSVVLSRN